MSFNSKYTRVQPVFHWLETHGGNQWPSTLLKLTHGLAQSIRCGALARVELDPERTVPATPVRLAWMLRNASRLAPQDGRLWEELRNRTANVEEVENALERLDSGDSSGLGSLCLEGRTHADCLVECEAAFIWIEGKRFDWLSTALKWDVCRDQLARNLEAVWTLANAADKDYCLLICHEHPLKYHEQLLVEGYRNRTWSGGWPHHLTATQRREFAKRIGTVTWQEIAGAWPLMRSLPELQDLR